MLFFVASSVGARAWGRQVLWPSFSFKGVLCSDIFVKAISTALFRSLFCSTGGWVRLLKSLCQEWYHAVGTPMGLGNMAWAKECVKKGVDVNARLDAYGGTALFLAIEQGNWSMVKWLLVTD